MSKTLPTQPSLEQLRKQARELLSAALRGDDAACSRFMLFLSSHNCASTDSFKLSDAQFVVAREYGFASWPKLKSHVLAVSSPVMRQQELNDALIRAANKLKDLKRVQQLVDAGADINGQLSESGSSALSWAACGGHIELMQFLLDKGADVNSPGNMGFSSLSCAAHKGQPKSIRFLLENGANSNPVEPNGFGVMLSATFGGSEEVARLLIEAASEVNIKAGPGQHGAFWFNAPYCGETPLHYAMAYGSRGMIQDLLDAGADLAAKNKHGESPLHWAGRHQRPASLMRWLRTIA